MPKVMLAAFGGQLVGYVLSYSSSVGRIVQTERTTLGQRKETFQREGMPSLMVLLWASPIRICSHCCQLQMLDSVLFLLQCERNEGVVGGRVSAAN
uniref:Uncharacterized protein n=1 Tax=Ixodes ricinus TaxID=34613 RepID=A0A6B0UD47_IXORI